MWPRSAYLASHAYAHNASHPLANYPYSTAPVQLDHLYAVREEQAKSAHDQSGGAPLASTSPTPTPTPTPSEIQDELKSEVAKFGWQNVLAPNLKKEINEPIIANKFTSELTQPFNTILSYVQAQSGGAPPTDPASTPNQTPAATPNQTPDPAATSAATSGTTPAATSTPSKTPTEPIEKAVHKTGVVLAETHSKLSEVTQGISLDTIDKGLADLISWVVILALSLVACFCFLIFLYWIKRKLPSIRVGSSKSTTTVSSGEEALFHELHPALGFGTETLAGIRKRLLER